MDEVARQLVRALRGSRSQQAFSRRLGYRSNPVAEWEAGRRQPTAAEVLRAARVAHLDVDGAFRGFHAEAAPALGVGDTRGVAVWLDTLRGGVTVVDLARRAGRSRFAVARWLSGEAEPRLPDFLRLVDALTGRVSDLVAGLVPIEQVPALAARASTLEASRRLARERPWSEAVVAALDTAAWRALPAYTHGILTAWLGLPPGVEEACLEGLLAGGVVEREGERLVLKRALVVDTAGDPAALAGLRRHWLDVARARVADPHPDDAFAYNVFSVRHDDLERIRGLYQAFYREVRQIVAASEPTDTVALLGIQLLDWEVGGDRGAG